MIIVDTNVISDVIAPRPTPSVFDWLRRQPADDIWTTAITAAELRAGVAALIDGPRKRLLGEAVEQALYVDFSGRILPFDDAASVAYAAPDGDGWVAPSASSICRSPPLLSCGRPLWPRATCFTLTNPASSW